jgi:histidine triad (HIT) family protein
VRDGCPFCDWDGPVLFEWGSAFVIEPLNPVVPGHALAIPRRHVPSADPLPFVTGPTFATAVMYARHAGLASYNLISSVGAPATQTVFHLHVHVVPRREGDGLTLPWSRLAEADLEDELDRLRGRVDHFVNLHPEFRAYFEADA